MNRLCLAIASLLVLNFASPVWAESRRYPTEQELQSLMRLFNQDVARFKKEPVIRDRRSPQEKQQRTAFVKAWAQVDPEVAPFLGYWTAIEESMVIYPSRTKGEVCILETFIPDQNESGVSLTFGKVVEGQIHTSFRTVLMQNGDFLGSASVYQDKPSIYNYFYPRPLQDPATVSYLSRDKSVITQFQQAGCTAALPSDRRTDSSTTKLPRTWAEFIQQGGSREIQVDYDLPNEFRNGPVYFNTGANQITAFIFKQGLRRYPPLQEGLTELDNNFVPMPFSRGEAIVLRWNLGNSGAQRMNDPKIYYPNRNSACLRNVCLGATFMTQAEMARILRSQHPINPTSP